MLNGNIKRSRHPLGIFCSDHFLGFYNSHNATVQCLYNQATLESYITSNIIKNLLLKAQSSVQTCPSESKAQLISRVGLYKYTTRKKTTSIHSQYQSWLYTTHYFTWLYFSLQWSHLSGNAKNYSGSISLLYFLSILWITKFIVQKNFAQKRSCLECVMSLHKSNKFHRNFYISPKVEKICLIIFFFHLPI